MLMSEDLSRDPGDSVGIFVKAICWPNFLPKDISLSQVIAEKLAAGHMPPPGLIGSHKAQV